VRIENSIDVQQCEGGDGGMDRERMAMPLRRASSWRWSETIDQSIFLIWGMRRKAKTDGIWEANTKEETQEKKMRYALTMASIIDLRQIFCRTLTTSIEMGTHGEHRVEDHSLGLDVRCRASGKN